ncbi:hypothetical protein ACSNOI_31185 [Actinomadura kijaniata]|uniref:hypothetical protein n=1 Tax=Actinomadura kijaniata TaxID=46161 RepID=UPI003F1941D4
MRWVLIGVLVVAAVAGSGMAGARETSARGCAPGDEERSLLVRFVDAASGTIAFYGRDAFCPRIYGRTADPQGRV